MEHGEGKPVEKVMKPELDIKGMGYLASTVSVVLLALTSLKSAQESTLALVALVLGCLLSISGMFLRWRSHRLDRKKEAQAEHANGRPPHAQERSAAGGKG